MIVGKIDVKSIEMVIIQVVDQRIILVPQIGIHQKVLAAAREHCAVSPDRVMTVVDRRDLHIAARRLCRQNGREGRKE